MIGDLADRLAIRERIEAYGDAVFRRNADDWAACWAETAEWDLLGAVAHGRAAIRAQWEGAMAGFSSVVFLSVVGAIAVEGDRATARVYTEEVLVDLAGAARKVWGAYDDILVRHGGAWLFQRRAYRILHTEP